MENIYIKIFSFPKITGKYLYKQIFLKKILKYHVIVVTPAAKEFKIKTIVDWEKAKKNLTNEFLLKIFVD